MKVAIESSLSPVRDYLSSQGCQVVSLEAAGLQSLSGNAYSAVVISGADKNVMGIQDIEADCPVINALGMTPEQVHQRIQSETNVH